MVSLKRLKEKAATVNTLIDDTVSVIHVKNEELAYQLENNYDELYTLILSITETLECVLSDIEE
ncbi:hypothetical protein [Clostridium weizhouense]|uniref:Uncharacterized protein n=1 Tax=Clostridium weizhouense TaxID=2859781 RepID=A0ABS7ANH5_9CLOT|nr:hypothetical protein [Clostridium weizhouense]MBW6409020.1 hypothetical protein [Clostridium weizhouense]